MKILINSLALGGAENQALILSQALGCPLLCLENEPRETVTPFAVLSNNQRETSSVWKFFSIPIYLWRLKKYVSKNEVVVSFLERSNFVTVLAKYIYGTKAIVCERTTPSRAYLGWRGAPMRFFIRVLYTRADVIVSNSEGVKQDLVVHLGIPPEKIIVIHNMYPIQTIEERAQESLPFEISALYTRKTLLTVNRLEYPKGHWHLLRSFALSKKIDTELRLIFLGDGSLKNKLVTLSRHLGLRTYVAQEGLPLDPACDVYFLGYAQNPYQHMKRARFFVLSSLREGFPNGIVESLICGTPVIAADCASGPREILAPGMSLTEVLDKPKECACGILMPALSGEWGSFSRVPDATEVVWGNTLAQAIRDDKYTQRGYTDHCKERARAFEYESIKKRWEAVICRFDSVAFKK